jgi:hypothetical protein
MENKELYSIFPELGHEVFEEKIEKPMELYLHANSNKNKTVCTWVPTHPLQLLIQNLLTYFSLVF